MGLPVTLLDTPANGSTQLVPAAKCDTIKCCGPIYSSYRPVKGLSFPVYVCLCVRAQGFLAPHRWSVQYT